jgi:hypothetical protein
MLGENGAQFVLLAWVPLVVPIFLALPAGRALEPPSPVGCSCRLTYRSGLPAFLTSARPPLFTRT